MKKLLFFVGLLLCIITAGCKEVNEQPSESKISKDHEQPKLDSQKVENIVNDIYEAMINRNGDVLDILCSAQLSYGHSSGLVQNKNEFIDDVVNGPFEFLTIIPEEQTIQLVGQTAFVRHVFVSKALNDGENVDIRIGCVQAYQYNEHGDLQLILRQAFKL